MTSLQKITRKTFGIFAPKPQLLVSDWANKFRFLPKEAHPTGGKYSTDDAPYQKEPMDAVNDKAVSEVVLMWPSQVGKTETVNNVALYHIDWRPSPVLVLQPTLDMAESWSKDRLSTSIRDTPALRDKVKDARSRDSNNTILHKRFPGGHITICGANSAASLASRPIRLVLADEVDRYPESAGTEGDPISLARKRTARFKDAKVFITSTPTNRGSSRVEQAFEETDKRYFFVPCTQCIEYQVLKWAQVRWVDGQEEGATYECEYCKAQWTDDQRKSAVKSGEWRPTAPFKRKRGYHLNGIYNPFPHHDAFKSGLHQMVCDYQAAKRVGSEGEKAWVNTFLAESWEEKGETVDSAALLSRRENYEAEIPDGVLFCTGSADVQGDRIEGTICGWGAGEECWFLKRAVFLGNPELSKVWSEFDDWITQPLTDRFHETFRAVRTFVDMRHKPKAVCAFTKIRAPLIYACYGADTVQLQIAVKRKRNTYGAVPFCIGVTTVKDILFARLKMTDAGPRYIHFPDSDDFGQAFFDSLTAEKRVTTMRFGFPDSHYEKIRPRNEELDKFVYAFAAMDTLKSNLEVLAKRRASVRQRHEVEKVALEAGTPVPAKPEVRKPARKNFVTGWQKW